MEKINCSHCVKNKEILHRIKGESNVVHTVRGRKEGRKDEWIDHIWL